MQCGKFHFPWRGCLRGGCRGPPARRHTVRAKTVSPARAFPCAQSGFGASFLRKLCFAAGAGGHAQNSVVHAPSTQCNCQRRSRSETLSFGARGEKTTPSFFTAFRAQSLRNSVQNDGRFFRVLRAGELRGERPVHAVGEGEGAAAFEEAEGGDGGEGLLDEAVVFLGLEGTGGIDEGAAGFQ